jgi:hypothetical protein
MPRIAPYENDHCPRYVALIGDDYLAADHDLDELLRLLADLFSPGEGEDYVIWNEMLTVAALLFHDGTTIVFEGQKAQRRH